MKKWDIFFVVLLVVTILISIYNLIFSLFMIEFLGFSFSSRIPILISSSLSIIVFSVILVKTLKKKKGGQS
jgi:hypothetical protein